MIDDDDDLNDDLNDDMDDEQYLKELYGRFRQDALKGNTGEYYTQDELLDIYDYAQDESDHFVMLYVLLSGARYYPDSDFLDERKALLLSTVSSDAARMMLSRKGRHDTALWRVLDISLDCVEGGDPSEKLSTLLESDMTLDSESVIWLIDNLHAARRHDLIVQNVDRMVEMAEDPAEVYHSAALALYNEGGEYYPHALAMVEELTKLDSFFVDGWILNARIEYQLDHFPQALQAIDYALALEPDNAEAAWVKSMIMPMTVGADNIPAIIEHIRKVVKVRPDWLPSTTALAAQYERAGNRSAMFATYDAFISRSKSTEDIIAVSVEALKKNPPDRSVYLQAIDRTVARDDWNHDDVDREQQWNKIAVDLISEGFPVQAEWVYDYVYSTYGLKYFIYNYLAVRYRNRNYAGVIEISKQPPLADDWQRRVDSSDVEGIFDRIKGWTYVAGALLKTGDTAESLHLCERILAQIPDIQYTVNDNIFVNGLRLQLRFLQQLSFNPSLIPDDDDFDPLTTQVDTVTVSPGRFDDINPQTKE